MEKPETRRSTRHPRPENWNKVKMADFLRELAATHCVAAAAKSVGMTRQSAYRLRARLKGEPFDVAWETAFQHGYDALAQAALERALHGVEVPHFHKGELVHVSRKYDERLTVYLLSARNVNGAQQLSRYGAASEFWSESWDKLLARIEEGSAFWHFENPGDQPDDETRVRQVIDRQLLVDPPGK
ncbi:hypothetical protein [Novosphingobium sp. AAP93]|uniref:hypothetical protein n=1 Tax=Novosphingobium sp. AAP93 TaxID=1523427 RepID=UPI0006B9382C|nr:hypothetical protein [Novosphingobium sp. AAP93]